MGDAGIALFGLGAKLQNYGGILTPGETASLPEHHAPTPLLDLLGQPLEVLPCLGVVGKAPESVVQHHGADSLQAPPDREPEAGRLPRKPVRAEEPSNSHLVASVTAVTLKVQ